ncbi:hypothetical protein V498_03539 [Pseudogymnoascus sp. VKM F-4517 (FW-2822)]|nr:hypothetical protein V498_03539 [Pseudogymnoascus sp. VKM F-4517 (FW-2822)]
MLTSKLCHLLSPLLLVGGTIAGTINAANNAPDNAPVVHLRNGSFYGNYNPAYNQDIFFSMPYAQPPLKDLRFDVPQSLNATWIGYRNATQIGDSCLGYTGSPRKLASSEDCLTMTVVRPAGNFSEPLPVALWIHGGGWNYGSSAEGLFNGSFLVDRSVQMGTPVIVASFNYRLAGWGWLWSPEVVEKGLTNVGLRDQRLAMHWIKENIASFGGDASRVTIFGESAGSFSVGKHLLAYGGRDDSLFSGAIGQSGAPTGIGPWEVSHERLSLATYNLTQTVCPNATAKLDCLRKADLETLDKAMEASMALPGPSVVYGPVIDGDILTMKPAEQMRQGKIVNVPFILGSNTDEASYYTPTAINTELELLDAITTRFGCNTSQALRIMDHYAFSDPENAVQGVKNFQLNSTTGLLYKRANSIGSDLIFKASTHLTAQLWSKQGRDNIYIYNANTTLSKGPVYYGSAHGYELAYTFYNLNGTGWEGNEAPFSGGNPFDDRPQPYFELADVMSGMWIGFINTRKPHYANQSVIEWPAYTVERPTIMNFDAQPTYLNTGLSQESRVSGMKLMISLGLWEY